MNRITPTELHDGAALRQRRLFEEALGAPFTEGNRIERLRNGDRIFPAMLAAIEAAEDSVELLSYIYWRGDIAIRFAEALAERARQGVAVRVLLDAWGAAPMRQELIRTMREGGVDLRWFRPLRRWPIWRAAQRTHRKVLVVDGRVGFTGGVGIAEEWCGDARHPGEWRDTHFRVTGPAVRGLRAAFIGNWAEAVMEEEGAAGLLSALRDGRDRPAEPGEAAVQVLCSSAGSLWSEVAGMTELAIGIARRRLRIGTAYFLPDEPTTAALVAAAGRGVEVEIMLPWPHMDMRVSQLAGAAAFTPLLRAGVAIQVFRPTMYHAKLLLVDEDIAVVGSANFNRRSAWQDEEVCLVCQDPALNAALTADWEADLARCEPVDLRRWRRRGTWQRVKEAAARVVKPMA
jgi:cardiolipin synthase A/B